jgi:hypothetical protein
LSLSKKLFYRSQQWSLWCSPISLNLHIFHQLNLFFVHVPQLIKSLPYVCLPYWEIILCWNTILAAR